jgi:WD40 repeat protein
MELRTDLFGDPLPPGALVRLGTIRLRQGLENFAVAFSPDGRLIASGGCDGRIYVWEATTGRRVRVLSGHDDKLYGLAWAPHGRWFATLGRDDRIRLWDPSDGRQLLAFDSTDGLESFAKALAISSDNRRLAWIDWNGRCHLWDMTSRGWDPGGGRPPVEIWRGSTQCRPAFLPDAVPDHPADWLIGDAVPDHPVDRLITVVDRTIRFHGLESGRVVRTFFLDEPFDRDHDDLVPCPAGQLVALTKGAHSELILLDVHSGEARHRLPMPWSSPGVVWSPDGRTLATYFGPDEGIQLWSAATGERLRVLSGPRHGIRALAFSPDGKVLAVEHDGHALWLMDVAAGERLLVYAGHEDVVHSIAFSLDGRQVATGGWDGETAAWDATTGRSLRQFWGYETEKPGNQRVWVAYHPDGRRLVTWSRSAIRIYDLVTAEELRHEPSHGFMGVGPGEEVYAVTYDDFQAPKVLRFRELASGRDLLRIPLSEDRARICVFDQVNQVFAVAFEEGKVRGTRTHQGGRIFVSPDLRRRVQWWATENGASIHSVEGLEGSPIVLKFSPDGKLLVAACEDRQIRAWDVATGELRALGPEGTSEQLEIAPDGRTWATRSDGERIILWDAAQGRPRVTATARHADGMIFSPDSRILVTGEYHEGIVLRDVETGALRGRVGDRQQYHDTFAFSPDGAVLAAACNDSTVLLWDFPAIRQ